MNDRKAVIIYGAGRAGAQLIESLRKTHDYAPVAFIDDDLSKEGTIINYTHVYSFKDLRNVLKSVRQRSYCWQFLLCQKSKRENC